MQRQNRYGISELISEANRLIAARNKDSSEAIEEVGGKRTVHHYVDVGLIEKPDGRGPKTSYSDDAVYQLVFVRMLQSKAELDLHSIAQVLTRLRRDQVRNVALGDEPFEVAATPGWAPAFQSGAPDAVMPDTDARDFGALSAKFAAMAQDFANTASEFARMAEDYSKKDKR